MRDQQRTPSRRKARRARLIVNRALPLRLPEDVVHDMPRLAAFLQRCRRVSLHLGLAHVLVFVAELRVVAGLRLGSARHGARSSGTPLEREGGRAGSKLAQSSSAAARVSKPASTRRGREIQGQPEPKVLHPSS